LTMFNNYAFYVPMWFNIVSLKIRIENSF
jgi:hypothetical protein